MNVKERPCQEDPGYSFTACLETAMSTKVGCSSPWFSHKEFKTCSTKSQILKIMEESYRLITLTNAPLVQHTGCKMPCIYREYSLADTPLSGVVENSLGVNIMFGSGTEEVAKEQLIYPLDIFIADIGGCLGLFLGFSFLTLYDTLNQMVAGCFQKLKIK